MVRGESVPRDLLEKALSISRNSYAPYSRFRVAAALRTGGGGVFGGVNVENSSYGLSMCAERVAAFSAVSSGHRKFLELLIYTPDSEEPIVPCGACLQVLSEFSDDMTIYSVSSNVKVRVYRLRELLASPFKLRRADTG